VPVRADAGGGVVITPAKLAAEVRGLVESGEAVRRRERAGLSLIAAGEACGGVHASSVQRWETGQIPPRGRNLRAYVAFLRKLATP
jgi:hypothetical protein